MLECIPSFCLVISTTVFGMSIVTLVRREQWMLSMHILSGWLIGSIITGMLTFVTTYLLPLSIFHVAAIQTIQIITSVSIYKYLKPKLPKKVFEIKLELSESLFLAYFIGGLASVVISNSIFREYPLQMPKDLIHFASEENTLINSVIYGVNKRRANLFKFQNPSLINSTYITPVIPALYASLYSVYGLSYPDLKTIFSFLNTLATIAAVSLLAVSFSRSIGWICLLFLFNGGWALFHFLFNSNSSLDYIHDCGHGMEGIHYQTLIYHLHFSLESSFTIPLTIFAIAVFIAIVSSTHASKASWQLIVLFAVLIPNAQASIGFFIFASCFPQLFFQVMPFAISIIPKVLGSFIHYYPIWREYQMVGIFYSQLVTMWDAFGPLSIYLFTFPIWIHHEWTTLHHFLAIFTSFIYFCFFREGNDHFSNSTAINSILLPMLVILFVKQIDAFGRKSTHNPTKHGIFLSIKYIIYISFIVSGILSIRRTSKALGYGYTESFGTTLKEWGIQVIKDQDCFISVNLPMNPLSMLAGKQALITEPRYLWSHGYNISLAQDIIQTTKLYARGDEMMKKFNIRYLLEFNAARFIIRNTTDFEKFTFDRSNNEIGIAHLKPQFLQ